MKILKFVCVVLALTGAAMSASAAPVSYTLHFDGSGSGPSGTGTFTYDAALTLGSNLTWNFGGGQTGGVNDSLFVAFPFINDIFFNKILFNSVETFSFTGAGLYAHAVGGTFGPFGEDESTFCWGTMSNACGMPNPKTALASYEFAMASYEFVDIDVTGGRTVYSGYMTATASVVPEPASAALLLAGLAVAGMARKRKPL